MRRHAGEAEVDIVSRHRAVGTCTGRDNSGPHALARQRRIRALLVGVLDDDHFNSSVIFSTLPVNENGVA
jgi:hypothetical protein